MAVTQTIINHKEKRLLRIADYLRQFFRKSLPNLRNFIMRWRPVRITRIAMEDKRA
jgi:hypothetical protein